LIGFTQNIVRSLSGLSRLVKKIAQNPTKYAIKIVSSLSGLVQNMINSVKNIR
jgi:hypothetical protein